MIDSGYQVFIAAGRRTGRRISRNVLGAEEVALHASVGYAVPMTNGSCRFHVIDQKLWIRVEIVVLSTHAYRRFQVGIYTWGQAS